MPAYQMLTPAWMMDGSGEQRVYQIGEILELSVTQAEYLRNAGIITPYPGPPSWSIEGGGAASDFNIRSRTGFLTSTSPIDQGVHELILENANAPGGPQRLRLTITVEDITQEEA